MLKEDERRNRGEGAREPDARLQAQVRGLAARPEADRRRADVGHRRAAVRHRARLRRRQQGYTLVLEARAAALLYADKALDITDAIVKHPQQRRGGAAATKPGGAEPPTLPLPELPTPKEYGAHPYGLATIARRAARASVSPRSIGSSRSSRRAGRRRRSSSAPTSRTSRATFPGVPVVPGCCCARRWHSSAPRRWCRTTGRVAPRAACSARASGARSCRATRSASR